ncbi:hypothetical protein Pcinc_025805 [Petrolisthes cinctipes]|uniref:Uncharacterized protein n=1 Tax=Petrolisthes cinctipes TaxID=88211 RepID=A0AAE1F7M3_PETCI|nr:hypothetical protein Pcinc_025805 [Petrolisthes cinctipes]
MTLIEEVTTLKKELCKKSEVEDKFIQLQSHIDYQEDYSRRNNLRFDGLDETPNETWEETQMKIQHLMRDKLEMGVLQLERVHRVGPKYTSTRPRTVDARIRNHTKLVIHEQGERTAQTQAVSTSPAASVMTVTPAATFAGGAASVGAVTGAGAVASWEASAGIEDDQREEGQEVAA